MIKDPILVPIAIPYICGPGVIAFILVHSNPLAIFLAWIASAAILLAGIALTRFLNAAILEGVAKLMGFGLTVIAVEMIVNGLLNIWGK